jgi:uncharacterized protein
LATIVVSHMLATSSTGIWYPALRDELTAEGHRVLIPDLPDPQAPKPQPWLKALTHAAEQGGPPTPCW